MPRDQRPGSRLAIAGAVGGAWAVALGLVTAIMAAVAVWVAPPRYSLGNGVGDVARVAVQGWLTAHHAGFAYPGGRVGLLPLGLLIVPAVLLARAGWWMARVSDARRLRGVGAAVLALAAPYGLLAGLLANLAGSSWLRPSVPQSLAGGFLLASVAGGMGAVRAVGGRRVLSMLPREARGVAAGTGGGVAVLVGGGALLVGVALAANLQQAGQLAGGLDPGVGGGFLLLLLQVLYLPNAVGWGVAYATGPGFAVGAGTSVAPSGVLLGDLPALPLLAALPAPGSAPSWSYPALAGPYLAGAVAGWLTARRNLAFSAEVTALWGLASGVATALAAGLFAALSGGPLADGRLAVLGPSGYEVAVIGTLEMGVSAAVAAWVTDRLLVRRPAGGN